MSKRIRKYTSVLFFSISALSVSDSYGQSTPQQIMENIYKSYDSLMYLTFDIRFTYSSDTLYGDFAHDVLDGTFTMAGKKIKYNLGDVEFIQNDSFLIAVYNNDKYIIVSEPRAKNSGNELPMRQVMNDLITTYSQYYVISVATIDSLTGRIDFVKNSDQAEFESFSITYHSDQYLLKAIDYSFHEPPILDSNVTYVEIPAYRTRRLKIEFFKYRGDNFSDSFYSENNYVFFEDGMYKPVTKYKDFQVFNSRNNKNSSEQPQQEP